jgi:hypothetical protein
MPTKPPTPVPQIEVVDVKMAGWTSETGVTRFSCPGCGMWQPDLVGVVRCLEMFHNLDKTSTLWRPKPGTPLDDHRKYRYYLVQRVRIPPLALTEEEEISIAKNILQRGLGIGVARGILENVLNRTKKAPVA